MAVVNHSRVNWTIVGRAFKTFCREGIIPGWLRLTKELVNTPIQVLMTEGWDWMPEIEGPYIGTENPENRGYCFMAPIVYALDFPEDDDRLYRLITAGADLRVRDPRTNKTLMGKCIDEESFDEILYIIGLCDEDTAREMLMEPSPARSTDPAIVTILERGPEKVPRYLVRDDRLIIDVTTPLAGGETLLHRICAVCSSHFIKWFLRRREAILNCGMRAEDGTTILHHAIENTCGKMVVKPVLELLVEEEVDLNAQDSRGETALHRACRLWKTKMHCARYILKCEKVDIDVKDNQGRKALDYIPDETYVVEEGRRRRRDRPTE